MGIFADVIPVDTPGVTHCCLEGAQPCVLATGAT